MISSLAKDSTRLRDILGTTLFDALAFGGSFSFSYVNDVEVHRYGNFVLVRIDVTNPTARLSRNVLLPTVKTIAESVPPDNFLTRFGDGFVVTGNELPR
jgi:hypothetical protein